MLSIVRRLGLVAAFGCLGLVAVVSAADRLSLYDYSLLIATVGGRASRAAENNSDGEHADKYYPQSCPQFFHNLML